MAEKLTRSARRKATGERVICQKPALAAFVDRVSPGLERRHFVDICELQQQAFVGHRYIGAVLYQCLCAWRTPIPLLARWRAKSNLTIGPARSRRAGRCRR